MRTCVLNSSLNPSYSTQNIKFGTNYFCGVNSPVNAKGGTVICITPLGASGISVNIPLLTYTTDFAGHTALYFSGDGYLTDSQKSLVQTYECTAEINWTY